MAWIVLVVLEWLLAASLLNPMGSPAACFELPGHEPCSQTRLAQAQTSSAWKFSRTQGKEGSIVAIMKTAETVQSDADFAGLIVRCSSKGKVDALVALIRPFPPRVRPQVTITAGPERPHTFEASMAASGVAVLLPDEVSAFVGGSWQTTPSLTISVRDHDDEIKGVVRLNGLHEAYSWLLANCGQ